VPAKGEAASAAADQRRWLTAGLLGVWTLLILGAAWWIAAEVSKSSDLVIQYDGSAPKPLAAGLREWVLLAVFNFHWALGWVFLSPYVFWFGSRFHLEKGSWVWRILALLAAGAVFIFVCGLLSRQLGLDKDVIIVFATRVLEETGKAAPGSAVFPTERVRLPAEDATNTPPEKPGARESTTRYFERRLTAVRSQMPRSLENIETVIARGDLPDLRADAAPLTKPFGPERGRRPTVFYAMDSAAYLALVGLAQAVYFHRRYRERERQAGLLSVHLAQARLRAVQSQLQPHFLFNTLNGIATLVRRNPVAAHEMVTSLSELLRLTLTQSDRTLIPLREELEFLDRYLEIQKMRFGDRLRVEREIDPRTLDCPVPPLVLQPLVENAIRHGLEPLAGPGCVRVKASERDGCLALRVEDNGVGTRPASGEAGGEHQFGLGLNSIRERLQSLFGARASLELRSGVPGGVVAEIQIPRREVAR